MVDAESFDGIDAQGFIYLFHELLDLKRAKENWYFEKTLNNKKFAVTRVDDIQVHVGNGYWTEVADGMFPKIADLIRNYDVVVFPICSYAENASVVRGVSKKMRKKHLKNLYHHKYSIPCNVNKLRHISVLMYENNYLNYYDTMQNRVVRQKTLQSAVRCSISQRIKMAFREKYPSAPKITFDVVPQTYSYLHLKGCGLLVIYELYKRMVLETEENIWGNERRSDEFSKLVFHHLDYAKYFEIEYKKVDRKGQKSK